jgi:hypothetical protein
MKENMKTLRTMFVGFLIGNIAHDYREMLDLSHVWGITIIITLSILYLWLDNAIEKKNKQNNTL